jgi:hypothetical protein
MSIQLPPGSYCVDIEHEKLGIRIATDLRASNRHKVASIETNRAFNRGLRVGDSILAVNEQLVCNISHGDLIKFIKNVERPLTLTLQRSFKSNRGADAIYTFSDGRQEPVRVVKVHTASEGGGYTISASSDQKERHAVEDRLNFDLCGDLRESDELDQSVSEFDIHRAFTGRSKNGPKWADCMLWKFGCKRPTLATPHKLSAALAAADKKGEENIENIEQCVGGKCKRCGFKISLDEKAIAQHGQTCSAYLTGTPIRR